MDRLGVIARTEIISDEEAAALRHLPGAKRVAMLDRLVAFGRELMLARLREAHPDWTEEERRAELSRSVSRAGE